MRFVGQHHNRPQAKRTGDDNRSGEKSHVGVPVQKAPDVHQIAVTEAIETAWVGMYEPFHVQPRGQPLLFHLVTQRDVIRRVGRAAAKSVAVEIEVGDIVATDRPEQNASGVTSSLTIMCGYPFRAFALVYAVFMARMFVNSWLPPM